MRIYFGTNRNPDHADKPTDFGNIFSPKGLTDLRFGWAKVNDKDYSKYQLYVAAEKLKTAKKEDQALGSNEVFETVKQEMTERRQPCVIFVHGFNVSFRDAIKRAATLKKFYSDFPMTLFLFTWPSDGSMLPYIAYKSDRDDARASGVALGRGLQKLSHYLKELGPEGHCNQNVHLFAHSMGTYALRWAFQSIRSSAGTNIRRHFEHILLFAADEDDDAFELEHKLMNLPDMARRVTVYHNPSDKALVVSDATKANPDRLGAGGPRNSRVLPDKVTVVNCEPVLSFAEDPTGHQYYSTNSVVRQDVIGVFKGVGPAELKTRRYQPETRSYRLKRG